MSKMQDTADAWLRGKIELAPVTKLLAIKPNQCKKGTAIVEMQAGKQYHNAMGSVHSGILCDLADVVMGVAFATTLEQRESFTSLGLQINFLRSVKEARLLPPQKLYDVAGIPVSRM